jgi:putative peptidoglycan binding protein
VALPARPPQYGNWAEMMAPIRGGEDGWRAYAVQRCVRVDADGAWGPRTEEAVLKWQRTRGLAADGVVGPRTQRTMIGEAARAVDLRHPGLPRGLLLGFAEKEGAMILGATNWYTPPGGDPGVDCGVVQWRQYGPPFRLGLLEAAFDAALNLDHAAQGFEDRLADYTRRRPALGRHRLVEAAVLAHNAPFLAEQLVRNGRLSTPNAVAVWTRKPGGGSYTHEQWSHVYPEGILEGVTY